MVDVGCRSERREKGKDGDLDGQGLGRGARGRVWSTEYLDSGLVLVAVCQKRQTEGRYPCSLSHLAPGRGQRQRGQEKKNLIIFSVRVRWRTL